MSETDKEDRTEDASPQRLEELAREGDVALGRDVVTWAGFGATILALSLIGGDLGRVLVGAVQKSIASVSSPAVGMASLVPEIVARILPLMLAVLLAAGLGSAGATAIQTRGRVWGNRLAPDPKRMFQWERLSRVFKREFLVDMGLSFAKAVLIGGAIYTSIKPEISNIVAQHLAEPHRALPTLGRVAIRGAAGASLAMAVLAAVDLFVQRARFAEKARMTKEQVKRERKDNEGDPLIKRQRKQRHRALMAGQIEKEVPKADVVLVNPTHIAIAIRYRRDEGGAPRVLCKGKGDKAERIRQIAREKGIAIMTNIPLARLLYRRVKGGAEIPEDTYRAVAAVLSFVYRLRARKQPGVER